VPRYLQELRDHLKAEESILAEIRESKELPDELAERLDAELQRFAKSFKTSEEPQAA
jgi:F0F1-type ATP synthase alpha subunit